MGTLYVAVDLFSPGAYRDADLSPGAETYPHLDGQVFAILHPVVAQTGPQAIPLDRYLKLDAGTLTQSHAIAFLSADVAKVELDALVTSGVPVPFPPGVALELGWTPGGGAAEIKVGWTIPGAQAAGPVTSPLMLALTDWPLWAKANFAVPWVTTYADIALLRADRIPGIMAELETFGLSLAARVMSIPKAKLSAAEQAAYDLLKGLEGPPPRSDVAAYLAEPTSATDATPRLGRLWERMLVAGGKGEGAISPPRISHDEKSMVPPNTVRLLGLADTGKPDPFAISYHQKLWREMGALAARGADGVGAATQAFGRLFGFGERLRWPAAWAADPAMMVLDPDSTRGAQLGWPSIGANIQSLLGQVIHTPVPAGPIAADAAMSITVQGIRRADFARPADGPLTALVADLGPPLDLTIRVTRDADRPDGFFTYMPKMANFSRAAAPAAAGSVYAAPGALLDAVDRLPRWSSPLGGPELATLDPPRTGLREGELHRADLAGKATSRRLSITVAISAYAAGSTTSLFAIGLPDALHAAERAELQSRFKALPAVGGDLWLPQKDGTVASFSLAGAVLAVETEPDGTLLAVVQDNGAADLRKAFDGMRPAAGAAPGTSVQIELLLLPLADATVLFNHVVGGLPDLGAGERAPIGMLKHSFTSRLSLSTDRMMDRFEAALSPSPFTPAAKAHAVLFQFGGFNKARFALSSSAPEVIARAQTPPQAGMPYLTFLTYPDAIIPIDPTGYLPASAPWSCGAQPQPLARHFSYYLSHAFTQDRTSDDAGDAASRTAAESLRFLNYLTPHIPWSLDGNLEHQYTQRVTIAGPNLTLPLATDVQNPATIAAHDTSARANLMEWALIVPQVGPPSIRIGFPRAFVGLIAAPPAAGADGPTRFRAFYEPLADLVSAVDGGTARLDLERWAFHPDGPHADTPHSGPQPSDSGSLSASMRLAGTHQHTFVVADAAFALIRQLLAGSFDALTAKLGALAQGPGDDWLFLDLPLSAGWTGLSDPAVVARDSDVLRLGLTLTRPEGSVAKATLLDPAHLEQAPGFGLPVDADQAKAYPELKDETFADRLADAAQELLEYLQPKPPSPLRTAFAWVPAKVDPTAAPPPSTATDPEDVNDARRFERLFGPSALYLIAPKDHRPQVDRVLDLFYATLAFRPLRAHPAIGDVETTLEFAEFLIQALDDLANGRQPLGFDVVKGTPAEAQATRGGIRADLALKVADLAVKLVTWVHNDAAAGSGADPRFDYVDALVKAALADGVTAELVERLTATPGLFATSKGFGVGIVEPSAWSDRLHSLQLQKQIHPAGPTSLAVDPASLDADTDRFLFPRILSAAGTHVIIDVLDDARYDDEFEIAESVFAPPRPPWAQGRGGVVLSHHALTARGSAQARTGEDVIELQNRFDKAVKSRQIEADVVHWNPNWILHPKAGPGAAKPRKFYLLPSRRAPATPVKLKPKVPPQPCDLRLTLLGPVRPNLNDQIGRLVAARLDEMKAIVFGTSQGVDLTATRLAKPLLGSPAAGAAGLIAAGWWQEGSYASEHYFLVETDEELNTGDIPFINDRFLIDVQEGPDPFADEDPAAPPSFDVKGPLGLWFNYRRLKQTDPKAPGQAPAAITLGQAHDELVKWLTPTDGSDSILKEAVPPVWSNDGGDAAHHRAWFSPGPGPGKAELRQEARDPGIGSILAAELMQLQTSEAAKGRFLLRVLVLDEAWRYTRVRVRIQRNMRDVNGDDIPDINPVFEMIGAFSAWSSHGREVMDIDFRQRSGDGLPAVVAAFAPPYNVAQFMGLGGMVDYGDLLGLAIDATFKDSNRIDRPFWNRDRARSQGLGLTGMVLQPRPDLHPRMAQDEQTDQLPSRIEDIPRLHLPDFLPPAPDLAPPAVPRDFGQLLRTIDRNHVPSPHHVIRIIWSNQKREPMLVCIWPVAFRT